MPSEGQPHLRTLMVWPDQSILPEMAGSKSNNIDLVRQQVASIANAISQYEPVWLYSKEASIVEATEAVSNNVTVKVLDSDAQWLREIGPLFISTSESILAVDDKTPKLANRRLSLSRHSPISLQGVPLETDNIGTLLITESCLTKTNPSIAKRPRTDIEADLQDILKVKKIIWLHGSDDSSAAAIVRFAPNNTVILSRPNNALSARNTKWGAYRQAKFALSATTNASGRKLDVVEIEEASVTHSAEVDTGRTGYMDFYLINGAVIVPQFGDENHDRLALEAFQKLWPDRNVVPVMMYAMVRLGDDGMNPAASRVPLESVEL